MAVSVQRRTVSAKITRTAIWAGTAGIVLVIVLPYVIVDLLKLGPMAVSWLTLAVLVGWIPVFVWLIRRPVVHASKALAAQDQGWAADAAAGNPDADAHNQLAAKIREAQADESLEVLALEVLERQRNEAEADERQLFDTWHIARADGIVTDELDQQIAAAVVASGAANARLRQARAAAVERMKVRKANLLADFESHKRPPGKTPTA
jgi:hypothetical protein